MQFIYGNEPYGIDLMKKKYLSSDKLNVRITNDLSDDDKYFLQSVSFFEDKKRLLLFIVDDPKKLKSIDKSLANENLVIIFYGKSSECFNFSENDYVETVCCNKYSDEQIYNLVSHSISAERDVINYFIKMIDYKSEDVCLYSVLSELEKLKVFKTVTKELIDATLNTVSAEENVFALGSMICAGKRQEVIKAINSFSRKNEMLYIGALQRYFRVGWKKNYFSDKSFGRSYVVKPELAVKAMKYLEQANTDIISGVKKPYVALLNAVILILNEVEVQNA